jgi:uncharacterized membrane protein YkoI
MKTRLAPLALGMVLALGVAPASFANDREDREAARAALARGELLPLPRILAIAAQRLPGDVVKVELESEKGRITYELRVLGKNGHIREIEIDAKSGAVLRIDRD